MIIERRRGDVRHGPLNGIDGVEASDDGRRLTVTFLGKAPRRLGPANVRIDGGRRITGIRVLDVQVRREDDPELDDHAEVTVDRAGDTSTYTLSVVEEGAHGRPGTRPLHGFDPRYASAPVRFRLNCPTDVDCADQPPAPQPHRSQPVIDYTARDYARLRRLLFDRLALTMPKWSERHAPDLGVTLVELLAYAGDQLSYYQDAVATEAYLDTARLRVSVRRHVRLVDYQMHDGCNARAWVALSAEEPVELEAGTFRFVSVDVSRLDPRDRPDLPVALTEETLRRLPAGTSYEIFEPVRDTALTVRPERNELSFWTWGEDKFHLPVGATSATLRDDWAGDWQEPAEEEGEDDGEERHPRPRRLALAPGDVLIVEEVIGPRTGSPADADPTHRQAVRLTGVTAEVDDVHGQPVLEVTWAVEDALTFPLCVATGGRAGVSVARGNVVLVDHGDGRGEPEEIPVPPGNRKGDEISVPLTEDDVIALAGWFGRDAVDRAGVDHRAPVADQAAALEALFAQVTYPPLPPRFRPRLREAPVTQRVPFPEPSVVSAGQSRVLAGLPDRARERLEELWRVARDKHRLTRRQIDEVATLFGAGLVEEWGLARRPARVLRDLLARFDRLLAAKLRRLASLRSRTANGEVLPAGYVWEIAHSWGPAYADGLDPAGPRLAGPAAGALRQDPRQALPALTGAWTPRRDLLRSGPRDHHVVGELEDDGRLALRFGDGRHGTAPPPGGRLLVGYRIGNGAAGNVGAGAIGHLVVADPVELAWVRNPMPAGGGADPEPVDQVRQLAPLAVRRHRLRAVTAADYAELASAVPGVQRAAAQLRWTGLGQRVHVAVDPQGAERPTRALLDAVATALEQYRRIGHDVVVQPAVLVPLDVELTACVAGGYRSGAVRAELRRALRALFDPDALTFGDPVRASRLVAAAAAVPGVTTARVTRLGRLFHPDPAEPDGGVLPLGPLEVAQLDDDPSLPENGRLTIVLGGER
ncbi:putative baseplate assembly protein [Actinoplanes sp. NPDC000266]